MDMSNSGREMPDSFQIRYSKKSGSEMTEEDVSILDHVEGIDDPYYRFGLGIYSFLMLLRTLTRYFAIMTVIAIVQMLLFYSDISEESYKVMQMESLGGMEKITSYLSLGSYFQAYPRCHHVNLIMDNLFMEC